MCTGDVELLRPSNQDPPAPQEPTTSPRLVATPKLLKIRINSVRSVKDEANMVERSFCNNALPSDGSPTCDWGQQRLREIRAIRVDLWGQSFQPLDK